MPLFYGRILFWENICVLNYSIKIKTAIFSQIQENLLNLEV